MQRMMLGPLRGFVASQARKQVAKRARREHYPAPYAILDLWQKYDGDPFQALDAPYSINALFDHPTTKNLIRIFFLQERMKALGKGTDFAAKHVHVVGAGVMGGDIAAICAMRGITVTLQDTAPERIAPAVKRAAKLFSRRLRDPRRERDALDRLIPDTTGAGAAQADVIIEAIFENVEAKRELFAETRGGGETRRDPRDQHLQPEAVRHRGGVQGSRAPGRHPLLQPGAADDAGRGRHGREHRPGKREEGRGLRAPDRQAAAAGQGFARASSSTACSGPTCSRPSACWTRA